MGPTPPDPAGLSSAGFFVAGKEVLAENPRVLKSPPPEVGITKLDDSGVQIVLRPLTG